MRKKGKTAVIAVIAAAIIAVIAVIFVNSSTSSEKSHEISRFFAQFILPYVDTGAEWTDRSVADTIVRKIAHCIIYFLLSVCLTVFVLMLRGRARTVGYVLTVLGILCIASADELIQGHFDRSGSALDVGIDMAGAAVGMLTVTLIYYFIIKIKKFRNNRKKD